MHTGYLWTAGRTVVFAAYDKATLIPVGTPISHEGRPIGLAARRLARPERWAFALRKAFLILAEENRDRLSDHWTDPQLKGRWAALWESIGCEMVVLWSAHHLMGEPEFTRLLDPSRAGTPSPVEHIETAPEPAARAAPADPSAIVLAGSPPGLWAPVERAPRIFPIGPRTPASLAIALTVTLAIVIFTLAPLLPR
jgi:hypothetical protein